eukprot:m.21186 g.21186  ORF g.21186 m.21186 type:complete len:63 (-) comp13287_c0_seq1:432-620(-)
MRFKFGSQSFLKTIMVSYDDIVETAGTVLYYGFIPAVVYIGLVTGPNPPTLLSVFIPPAPPT